DGARAAAAAEADGGYLAPPQPDAVRTDANGVVLSGRGPAGAQVRLARPTGEAIFATADGGGRWTIQLGPAAEPRIFGLSATVGGRQTQAQGYLLVTPRGQAALLRAGAGALRVDATPGSGLRAIDFDVGGGLEITTAARPRAAVIVRLDGRQVAQGRADDEGRYAVSLPPAGQPPIRPGTHVAQASGDGFTDTAAFVVSRPQPLAAGPLSSQLTPAGLRVDWMTPGGGVQSTILVH
ncbi:MAG TPA: Ig-like domain-containing protein, partial [Phenylobacterium sp.]